MQNAAASTVPALDTERLTLRGHTLADYDECVALWSDPVVTRYIGGRPSTAEGVWPRVLRSVGQCGQLRCGCWVLRERASCRCVGAVGLGVVRREIPPELQDAPEAG